MTLNVSDDGRVWEPGTAEDLVADAAAMGVSASTRMITDWVENGLLASPGFRKSASHGSDQRIFSTGQRRMFSALLQARERSPNARIPLHRIAEVVLHVWLLGDGLVDTPQARRAWRTWARGAGQAAVSRRGDNARALVGQLAHPQTSAKNRRAALAIIDQAEQAAHATAAATYAGARKKSRRGAAAGFGPVDWEKLYGVLTAASLPALARPGSGIERGYGPGEAVYGLQELLVSWKSAVKVTVLLAHEQVDEEQLRSARTVHIARWDAYQRARIGLHAQSSDRQLFAPPRDFEDYSRQFVKAFITVLGHQLGTLEESAGEVRKLDALVRRTRPIGI